MPRRVPIPSSDIDGIDPAIRQAIRKNPLANLTEISGLTGIPVSYLKQILKGVKRYARLVAHGANPGPPPRQGFGPKPKRRDKKMMSRVAVKPLFIREFEEHTGMECSYMRRTGDFSEWAVVSPRGIILVTLLGVSDTIQHIGTPKPWQVQGIRYHDYTQRRSQRAQKAINAENAAVEELDDQPD